MRIFILEDDQERIATFRRKLSGHTLTVVETAKAAIDVLENDQAFDIGFLDHDLGGEQMVSTESANTGSEVVRWMRPNQRNYFPIIIHSMNQPAALDMQANLEDVGMVVYRIPFSKLVHDLDDPTFMQ